MTYPDLDDLDAVREWLDAGGDPHEKWWANDHSTCPIVEAARLGFESAVAEMEMAGGSLDRALLEARRDNNIIVESVILHYWLFSSEEPKRDFNTADGANYFVERVNYFIAEGVCSDYKIEELLRCLAELGARIDHPGRTVRVNTADHYWTIEGFIQERMGSTCLHTRMIVAVMLEDRKLALESLFSIKDSIAYRLAKMVDELDEQYPMWRQLCDNEDSLRWKSISSLIHGALLKN